MPPKMKSYVSTVLWLRLVFIIIFYYLKHNRKNNLFHITSFVFLFVLCFRVCLCVSVCLVPVCQQSYLKIIKRYTTLLLLLLGNFTNLFKFTKTRFSCFFSLLQNNKRIKPPRRKPCRACPVCPVPRSSRPVQSTTTKQASQGLDYPPLSLIHLRYSYLLILLYKLLKSLHYDTEILMDVFFSFILSIKQTSGGNQFWQPGLQPGPSQE